MIVPLIVQDGGERPDYAIGPVLLQVVHAERARIHDLVVLYSVQKHSLGSRVAVLSRLIRRQLSPVRSYVTSS